MLTRQDAMLCSLSHLISVTACERVREAGAEGAGGQEAAGWKLVEYPPPTPAEGPLSASHPLRLLEVRGMKVGNYSPGSAHLPALPSSPGMSVSQVFSFLLAVLSTGLGIPQVLGPSLFLSRGQGRP